MWHPFSEHINLHVQDCILPADAARQMHTARALLHRLAEQPGVILADEVGMGKTYVALAVAASVAVASGQPAVIMVPPALKEKWPQDFAVFREHCWRGPPLRCAPHTGLAAQDGTAFLRLLDDPPSRRAHLIFVTHGALHRGLTDPLVKLAIIQRAIRGRHLGADFRRRLPELAREILVGGKSLPAEVIAQLLKSDPGCWNEVLGEEDEPVPRDVRKALELVDAGEVLEALRAVPQRRTASYEERLKVARARMAQELRQTWRSILRNLSTRLPLLVLDEAHHTKNERTQLAGLISSEGQRDGPSLDGLCERYLFLTATPFQLGHAELCGVISRFDGINWKSRRAPERGQDDFRQQVKELGTVLDRAQRTAQDFEKQWSRLRNADLCAGGIHYDSPEAWWQACCSSQPAEGRSRSVAAAALELHDVLREAEGKLRPWVVRHLKPRAFAAGGPRRRRLTGDAILHAGDDLPDTSTEPPGLPISRAAVLPFLLAARAAALSETGTLFAEGLASSYEAFRDTRIAKLNALDDDAECRAADPAAQRPEAWHLDRILAALPPGDLARAVEHPKVQATVERALELWRQREKVLIFCHFRQTGSVLREVLSARLEQEISALLSPENHARWERRLDDADSPARRACDAEVAALLAPHATLQPDTSALQDIVRRFLRTPAYMARYAPAGQDIRQAFTITDPSGQSLGQRLAQWFAFLTGPRAGSERAAALHALRHIATGEHTADEAGGAGTTQLSPLVRLVRGGVKDETKRRLATAFNAPFFPEILIASSVMAEGVDLHRACRHVIHHDLCWNPATLEQRTGRLDRIGGKHEQVARPLHVWLPWLAGTQDEKQFRVVTLRERWFGIVMGEKSGPVAGGVEEESLPLPEALARRLSLRLEAQPK